MHCGFADASKTFLPAPPGISSHVSHAARLSKNVSAPQRRQPERRLRRCSPTHETRRDKGLRADGIPIAIARPQRIRCGPETPVDISKVRAGHRTATRGLCVSRSGTTAKRGGGGAKWGATSEEEWSEWFVWHTNHSRPQDTATRAAKPILPVHVGRAVCRCVSRRGGFLRWFNFTLRGLA
ncbi:hypothetical protein BX592_107233 [Paraburkholderia rhizosphaerae]|uniref:Uncharacterized protein n=1 Tax=Paraburkholderia rhizosphaerae TaxID=480658 RepID=A0A4R8LXZ4_9BURK|nr:hypothetical protein BX592_107233 [Paraburkholderia rhizosphaerae]